MMYIMFQFDPIHHLGGHANVAPKVMFKNDRTPVSEPIVRKKLAKMQLKMTGFALQGPKSVK